MNTQIRGLQIKDAFFGDGLKRNVSNNDIAEVDIKTNDGLEFDTNQLTIAYDDATIGIVSNALAVKDDSLAEAKLDISNAPADGYLLSYKDGSDQLTWVSPTTVSIGAEDLGFENESANCDGEVVAFTLASAPVANSLQIFLNGLLQEEGSGKDYTVSGTTVTFAVAPEAGDILLVYYVK